MGLGACTLLPLQPTLTCLASLGRCSLPSLPPRAVVRSGKQAGWGEYGGSGVRGALETAGGCSWCVLVIPLCSPTLAACSFSCHM